jgi:hypothetical protein
MWGLHWRAEKSRFVTDDLFGPLKQRSGIGPFESNGKVGMAIREWLRMREPDSFREGIFKPRPKCDKWISVLGSYVEK